jgi:hypothetical protein
VISEQGEDIKNAINSAKRMSTQALNLSKIAKIKTKKKIGKVPSDHIMTEDEIRERYSPPQV